ncbi:MAG: S26 family signal peptidase [Planctomycetia bacterium]|nr:S26 family signal peptidase [Planctomycetia bacterium]
MRGAISLFLAALFLAGCSREERYRVEGDSMLPGLRGETRECVCPYCGYAGWVSARERGVCANCLGVIPDALLADGRVVPGEMVTVVACSGYNYDDVVVVLPDGKTPCVKRVVGCPGDRVAIRDGKIFVNGRRWVRTLSQWERERILVHDDGFRPEGVSRWVSDDGWRATEKGWTTSERSATLAYHHAEGRLETRFVEGEKTTSNVFYPSPVTNRLAGNGTAMRSEWTFPVSEFQLIFSVEKVSGTGRLEIFLPMGEEWGCFAIPAKEGEYLFSTLDGIPRAGEAVSVGREPILESGSPEFPLPKIKWTGEGTVQITRITLFRGEFWLPDRRNSRNFSNFSQKTLAKEGDPGYYLVGDNSLRSEDSRRWGRVPAARIRGLVRRP